MNVADTLLIPDGPLKLAVIGAGSRAQSIYQPLWESLKLWCLPVAIWEMSIRRYQYGGHVALATHSSKRDC